MLCLLFSAQEACVWPQAAALCQPGLSTVNPSWTSPDLACTLCTSMPCLTPELSQSLHEVLCFLFVQGACAQPRAAAQRQPGLPAAYPGQAQVSHCRQAGQGGTPPQGCGRPTGPAAGRQYGMAWHRKACRPAPRLQRAAVVVALLSTPRTLHTPLLSTRCTSVRKVATVVHRVLTLGQLTHAVGSPGAWCGAGTFCHC